MYFLVYNLKQIYRDVLSRKVIIIDTKREVSKLRFICRAMFKREKIVFPILNSNNNNTPVDNSYCNERVI